jgi:hypothetical protein
MPDLLRRRLARAGVGSATLAAAGWFAGGIRLTGAAAPSASIVGAGRRAVDARPTAPAVAPSSAFQFGFVGDTPYSDLESGSLQRIFAAMADEPLEFVLHVGDLKSSGEACSDAILSSRLQLLDGCPYPLVLTPGDNDWTDCLPSVAPWAAGGCLERLGRLRSLAYAAPVSLGRRAMSLAQQGTVDDATALREDVDRSPRLPENQRWRTGAVRFCTVHVVGSNNAPRRTPELERAWLARQEANARWLEDTVRLALREKADGLVKGLAVALHANMQFGAARPDGWARMRGLVVAAAVAFDGPFLLLHGDTHFFRSDRLLKQSHGLANLHRMECFGSPFAASWVQVRWDPSRAIAGIGRESDPFQVSVRALP